jgi:hypothetical protein
MLASFAGKQLFGEMDLAEAFMQFELTPESRKYTAFSWNNSQYQFRSCPYGIKHIPSHFQRCITTFFSDYKGFAFPYIDNIIFASDNWSEHEEHAKLLVDRLIEKNLRLKPNSVNIGHAQLKVLGRLISAFGMFMDAAKREEVLKWPLSQDGANLHSFLGFTGFLSDHIRNYAELTAPLHKLKTTKGRITWTDNAKAHFDLLKRAVANAPWLKYPDFNKEFYIACDASQIGIGGILYQPDEGSTEITSTNIVAICSRKFTDVEQRYSAYKKELRALVYCLMKFHAWIVHRKFTIVTDHKPLLNILTQKNLSNALQQWLDVIIGYTFDVIHRPGIMHVLPDALSRLYSTTYSDPSLVWGTHDHIKFLETASKFDTPSDSLVRAAIASEPKQKAPVQRPRMPTSGGGKGVLVNNNSTTNSNNNIIEDENEVTAEAIENARRLALASLHRTQPAFAISLLNRPTAAILNAAMNDAADTLPVLTKLEEGATSRQRSASRCVSATDTDPILVTDDCYVTNHYNDNMIRVVNALAIPSNIMEEEGEEARALSASDYVDQEASIQYGAGANWQVAALQLHPLIDPFDVKVEQHILSINAIDSSGKDEVQDDEGDLHITSHDSEPVSVDIHATDPRRSSRRREAPHRFAPPPSFHKRRQQPTDPVFKPVHPQPAPSQSSSSSSSSSSPQAAGTHDTRPLNNPLVRADTDRTPSEMEKLLWMAERRGLNIPLAADRRSLLEKAHAVIHEGVQALERQLYAQGIWWPNMRKDIEVEVHNCPACIEHKVKRRFFHPARPVHASIPGAHWQMDLTTLPTTPDGYRYLLVLVDVFSGFVILRGLKENNAETVAEVMWQVFSLVGPPRVLQNDNDPVLCSAVIQTLCRKMGVQQRWISAYNAPADGKVESAIGKIKAVLATDLRGKDGLWMHRILFIQLAFNVRITKLTGSSPFVLMFNRACNVIHDYSSEGPPQIKMNSSDPKDIKAWEKFQQEVTSIIYPAIELRAQHHQEQYIKKLDDTRRNILQKALPPGTEVVLVDGQYAKGAKKPPLKGRYKGTRYIVDSRSANGAYRLRYKGEGLGFLERRVPLDQLYVLSGPRYRERDDDLDWQVDKILDDRISEEDGGVEYLVKWKGFTAKEATWEPEININEENIIRKYMIAKGVNPPPAQLRSGR